MSWDFSRVFEENETTKIDPDELKSKIEERNGKVYPENLLAQYPLSVLDFWANLSYIRSKEMEDWVRIAALESASSFVWNRRPSFGDSRELFYKVLMQEVNENVLFGFYPAVTRIALIILAQPIPSPQDSNRSAFLSYIKSNLLPKIAAREKMADGTPMEDILLSKHVYFDHPEKKLYWFDAEANAIEI